MSSEIAWYAARAGGLTAWVLLSATVVLGLLVAARFPALRGRTAALTGIHRYVSELAMVFVGVHLAGLVADSTVNFGSLEILVPFTSSWRPLAVSFGVVALWTVVAVFVTSLLRDRLSRRVWHAVHMSSYAVWIAVSAHLLGAGTDAFSRVVEVVNVGCVTSVVVLAALALTRYRQAVGASPPRASDKTTASWRRTA